DGNFLFGGSPTDSDFIVGVRQSSVGTINFTGLYYGASLLQDDSQASGCGCAYLESAYGGLISQAGGYLSSGSNQMTLLEHQRLLVVAPSGGGPYDNTFSDVLDVSNYTDSYNTYYFG